MYRVVGRAGTNMDSNASFIVVNPHAGMNGARCYLPLVSVVRFLLWLLIAISFFIGRYSLTFSVLEGRTVIYPFYQCIVALSFIFFSPISLES